MTPYPPGRSTRTLQITQLILAAAAAIVIAAGSEGWLASGQGCETGSDCAIDMAGGV